MGRNILDRFEDFLIFHPGKTIFSVFLVIFLSIFSAFFIISGYMYFKYEEILKLNNAHRAYIIVNLNNNYSSCIDNKFTFQSVKPIFNLIRMPFVNFYFKSIDIIHPHYYIYFPIHGKEFTGIKYLWSFRKMKFINITNSSSFNIYSSMLYNKDLEDCTLHMAD